MARKQGAFSTSNKPVSQRRGGLSGVAASGGQAPVKTGRRPTGATGEPIRNGSRVRQFLPSRAFRTTNPPASGRQGVTGSPTALRDSGGKVDQSNLRYGSPGAVGGFVRRAVRSGRRPKQKGQLMGQTFRRGRVQNDNVGSKGGIGVEYVGRGGTKRGQ